MKRSSSDNDGPALVRNDIGGEDVPRSDEYAGRQYHFPRPEVPGAKLTLQDLYRFDPLTEEGPGIVYEAYVVAHAGTANARHVQVYRGGSTMFIELLIDEAIAEGFGTFGYITKNSVRMRYHRGRSSLRSVG
jgi:hypothetical protein